MNDRIILLSVVVIGRNEGKQLIDCLRSVQAITPLSGDTELIYVDSASTDDSIAQAQELGVNVIALPPNLASAAAARNAGYKAAKGEFVLFLDGDMTLTPTFCLEALKQFQNPKIAVVCGHLREKPPLSSIYDKVLDLDWISPAGFVSACGGGAIIRKNVLEEVGGYDTTLIAGEEPELCLRIREKGYLVFRLDMLMTYHKLGMTSLSQYCRRAFRTGYAYAQVSRRYKDKSDPIWRWNSIHNLIKGTLLVAALPICLFAYVMFNTTVPFLLVVVVFFLLVIRSAIRIHKQSHQWTTSLFYGLHAHLQHLPMFAGQLSYFWK